MITKPSYFRMRTTNEFDAKLDSLSEQMQLPKSKVIEKLVEKEYEQKKEPPK